MPRKSRTSIAGGRRREQRRQANRLARDNIQQPAPVQPQQDNTVLGAVNDVRQLQLQHHQHPAPQYNPIPIDYHQIQPLYMPREEHVMNAHYGLLPAPQEINIGFQYQAALPVPPQDVQLQPLALHFEPYNQYPNGVLEAAIQPADVDMDYRVNNEVQHPRMRPVDLQSETDIANENEEMEQAIPPGEVQMQQHAQIPHDIQPPQILPGNVELQPQLLNFNEERQMAIQPVENRSEMEIQSQTSEIDLTQRPVEVQLPQQFENHEANQPIQVLPAELPDLIHEDQIPVQPANFEMQGEMHLPHQHQAPEPLADQERQVVQPPPDNAEFSPMPHYLGKMTRMCIYCESKYFKQELNSRKQYNKCCMGGLITLDPIQPPPPNVMHLYTGTTEESRHFLRYFRNYNSLMAMASWTVNVVRHANGGPPVITIHGNAYHMTGVTETDRSRKYAELYIMDTQQALQERQNTARAQCLDLDMVALLQNELMAVNRFAQHYKTMGEVLEEQRQQAIANDQPIPTFKMIITGRPEQDRRYDNPTAREIAAVYTAHNGGAPNPENRELQVRTRHGNLMKINALNAVADPLTYPLLFFHGDRGYSWDLERLPTRHAQGQQNINRNRRIKLTVAEYYSYRIQVRDGISTIHSATLLFQQYLVNAFTKIEGNKLAWVLWNQRQLRADSYRGLMDHLNRRAEIENEIARANNPNQPIHIDVGRVVILPSSFPGSPRNMYQNFQDAMTIVRKYGKPDIFLTMTANPRWREIAENILPHQIANDRPDIVTRVFQPKLQALLEDVLHKHVLGHVIAYVYVIEFQKRGLPHAHMILFLSDADRPRTPQEVDKLISAEIPDSQDAKYNKLVRKHMTHGPCGHLNPRCVCMDNNKCKKRFPKDQTAETQLNVNGYSLYRRRCLHPVNLENHVLDDTWVVPHNRHLLLKYQCHINVEICSTVKSVKYIFKYIHKGQDMAHVEVVQGQQQQVPQDIEHDEVRQYINARYIGPHEAVHRILHFSMHEKSHTIKRLHVHLPNQQVVYFQDNDHVEQLQDMNERTTLTSWFELNAQDPNARQFLYHEIPEHYVFNERTKTWKARQRRTSLPVIGRIYQVHPRPCEQRFALRLLLLHKRGSTSFEDLRTVEGNLCNSFKDAALAMGLLEDDAEITRCLEEAVIFDMPTQLRQLFATLLLFQTPSDIAALFNRFKEEMSEDFVRRDQLNHPNVVIAFEDRHMYQCLHDIDNNLKVHGQSITNYDHLPQLPADYVIPEQEEYHMDVANAREEGEQMLAALNPEQQAIYTAITDAINTQSEQNCHFVDGPAGTGKTFLYNTLVHNLQANGHKVQCMAWSGIAATLLINGRTSHSTFQIPIPLQAESTCNVKRQSRRAQLLRETTLFIWDEASMIPALALQAVDRLLRDITHVDSPFGGKFMLLGGDFRQVLPVVTKAGREKIVAESLKSHQIIELWTKFRQHRLQTNMRAIQDESYREFSEWLLRLGNKQEPHDVLDNVTLPQRICTSSKEDMLNFIFPRPNTPDSHLMMDPVTMSERCCLTPKNDLSHQVNDIILDRLQTAEKTYYSTDSVVTDDPHEEEAYPIEFLNQLTPNGMPLHRLNLKVGATIILLRNLNPKKGLCNGTRLIVRNLRPHVITAEIITKEHRGQQVMIPRITVSTQDTEMPFTMKRRQFPVRLAYCLTINKAQGQSLRYVGLYLPEPVFTHGQLYVAMSRATSFNGLKVFLPEETHRKTKNIVFQEVL